MTTNNCILQWKRHGFYEYYLQQDIGYDIISPMSLSNFYYLRCSSTCLMLAIGVCWSWNEYIILHV